MTDSVAWLAGIVEGEGCISATGGSPALNVVMTDRDVVNRVAEMFGIKARVSPKPTGRKTAYIAQVCGETAAAWLADLFEFFGERRKAKALEVLTAFGASRGKHPAEFCKRGHCMIEGVGNCKRAKTGYVTCLDCLHERQRSYKWVRYQRDYYIKHRDEKLVYASAYARRRKAATEA